MKPLSELLQASQERLKTPRGDFPSYAHEIAWMLATEFDEPYGMWVRNVQYAKLNPGQIKYEYEHLKGKGLTRRQKVKILMSKMDVHVNQPKDV